MIELEPNGAQKIIEASLREDDEDPNRLILDPVAAAEEIKRQTGKEVDVYSSV